MKNIVIGTAGHVDHGKTALIKSLTGIDTDRLKEEKKRGITIDLGFAYLTLPGGEKAGIIDVPGHEKFVKNMLAGAGGIDLALLVVAADDGVMPQTREHLGILQLLGIPDGLVVITKADLADADWVEMVAEDIKNEVKGTFLEGAPVQVVSAYTGQGMEELKALLYEKVAAAAAKSTAKPFRIPVDRVFSVEGFGTVVTGTLIEGSVAVGDEVQLYPGDVTTRVRNLQVHGADAETAYAGQRVAVNLQGLKKEEVHRGETLAVPGSMQASLMLDVKLQVLRDSERVVQNGSRLHFYHGARDELAKVVLLDTDELAPGAEGYAQLRFTQAMAVKKGDRFVVRFYSPLETVGGGVVLDAAPQKHRRKQKAVLDALAVREAGSAADNLLQAIDDASPAFTPLREVQKQLGLDDETFRTELAALTEAGSVVPVSGKIAISAAHKAVLGQKLAKILGDYHAANPLQPGMRRDELRGKLLPGRELSLADKILGLYEADGLIRADNQRAALATFTVQYSEADQKTADALLAAFRAGGYIPPSLEEALAAAGKDAAGAKRVFDALLGEGKIVMASPQVFFAAETVADARQKIKGFAAEHGEITLAQFRDLSGSSRKFALPLLEYFDRQGITRKVGDARVLAKVP